jgi:anti-sigma factor RsiW
MNWACEQIEERLIDYLDGALTAAESAAISAHVAECAHCAPLVESVRHAVVSMHALEPLPVPPGLTARILDATIGPQDTSRGWRAWLDWTRVLITPKFAYGALTTLITGVVISQSLGIQWRRPTVADLNPVNLYRSADKHAHLIYARGSKFVGDLRIVYEIQSRLQPAEPEQQNAAPPQTGGDGHSEETPKAPQHLNRVSASPLQDAEFACAFSDAPERSNP